MATSLPSAFRSVDCILDGHAFDTDQVITGLCSSSRSLMVMSLRNFSFPSWYIKVFFQSSKNSKSPRKVPRLSVISLYFVRPGCFVLLYVLALPSRYSMG